MNSAQRIAREFDRKAPDYETDRLADWYIAQNREILRTLEPDPSDVVVDIGCGTGWLLREIAREYPAVRCLGLDLSAGMIMEARRLAQQAGLKRLQFVQGNWEQEGPAVLERHLNGKEPTRLFCVSTFHYFHDPVEALSRMREILQADGELYVMERTKTGSPLTIAWGWLHRHIIHDSVTFYDSDELRALIDRAGFQESRPPKTVRRVLWNGKLYTSLILLMARRSTEILREEKGEED